MLHKWLKGALAIGGAAMFAAASLAPATAAQRGEDWDWPGNDQRLNRITAGTYLTIRTTQSIVGDRADGRIFSGVVADDVWDEYRRLAVPAIPRGSRVELIVRTASDGDLILDLESVYANGRRYAVSARPERVEGDDGRRRDNDNAAGFVGGGALLGSVIGAIAGGGKGAAIGAATGAAAGLGLAFRGRSVQVPAGSLLNFRLDRGLDIGIPDRGFSRNRRHYHPERDDRPEP